MRSWPALNVCLVSLAILSAPAARGRGEKAAAPPRLARILAQPAIVEFDEAPLADILDYLRARYHSNIVLDVKALDDVGLTSDVQVTFHMRHGTLAATLTKMLEEPELTWVASGEVLEITTPEEAESELVTVVYDVRDLVAAGQAAEIHPVSSLAALQLLLPQTIAPETWERVGGPGSIQPFRELLIVGQTREIHQQFEEFLAEFRRVKRGDPRPPDAFEARLDATVALSVTDCPLTEMAARLGRQVGLDVLVDHRALDDVGLEADRPVTGSLEKLPLRASLRKALKSLELTWIRRDEAVIITTPEEADSQLESIVYDVRGLLPATSDRAAEIAAWRQLIDRLHAAIAPETWDSAGGPASAAPFDGMLVVSHTQETQEQVRKYLAALPSASANAARVAGVAAAPQRSRSYRVPDVWLPRVSPRLVTCDFRDTPLDEALWTLERAAGVRIRLDTKELDDVGLTTDVPVSLRLANLSVETTLDYLLPQLELTWLLRDGVIHVTTPEAAEDILETRRYAVADLLNGADRVRASFELTELILATVAPETWEGVGGPGSLKLQLGELEVSHTQRIHWKIAALLESVRAVLRGP